MQSGKLRNRVEIQSRTINQDDFGDALQTWTTVATRWAEIAPASGSETWQSDQQRPTHSHTITLRYYAGLTVKHRLKLGSRVFNIESVSDQENRHREHVIAAREEV